jgi:hypothetical protein
MAKGTLKMKMDIDRHGPRLMPNNCKNFNPPYFSLPSTFKTRKTHAAFLLLLSKKIREKSWLGKIRECVATSLGLKGV